MIITSKDEALRLLKNDDTGATGEYVLRYASEELRGDREVVLEALKSIRNAYELSWVYDGISEKLRRDREFVLE